jgi:pimeloyl-ACP methyl ester carboxylesterase
VAGAAAVVLLGASVVAGVPLYRRYQADVARAHQRLAAMRSQIAQTACGPIEYATFGEGTPVLEVHGIFGGFDQGLMNARPVVGEGFRVIAPSRFGYLRTPMPADASVERQADAHACLLDYLGVERAVVMGHSAGSTSAIQLALRHPERVSALVLVVPNAPGPELALPPKPLIRALFQSDVVFWFLATYAPAFLPIRPPDGLELTPEQRQEMATLIDGLLPAAPRGEGFFFDMFVSNPAIGSGYALADVAVPTLVVTALDDSMASPERARTLASRIPGAQLVTLPSGGHVLLGQAETVRGEIGDFLAHHGVAPVSSGAAGRGAPDAEGRPFADPQSRRGYITWLRMRDVWLNRGPALTSAAQATSTGRVRRRHTACGTEPCASSTTV